MNENLLNTSVPGSSLTAVPEVVDDVNVVNTVVKQCNTLTGANLINQNALCYKMSRY